VRAAVVRGKGSYARRGAGGLHPKQGRRGLRADTTPQTNAKVGETAPDFALHSSTGKDITLSQYRGKKNVVLAFIVKAFSGG
jgi:hypothetical protein